MRANEFIVEQQLDEGWKGALAAVGFIASMLAGTIIGTHRAEVSSHLDPVRSTTSSQEKPMASKEELLKKVYGDNYYENAVRPMIIKNILDMAKIVHGAHSTGISRSGAISMLVDAGASGEQLKMGSAIATLEYSMPEGYWTSEEFEGIVYREVIKNIPEHD